MPQENLSHIRGLRGKQNIKQNGTKHNEKNLNMKQHKTQNKMQ